jgi:hypothetical protein
MTFPPALVTLAAVLLCHVATVDAAGVVSADSLVIAAASAFTSTKTTVVYTFTYDKAVVANDKIVLKLPGFGLAGTDAPSKQGCGTTTFTTAVAATGEADAAITFTAATATLTAAETCTLTTNANTVTSTAAVAQSANLATRTAAFTVASTGGADSMAATAITASTALALGVFSDTAWTFTSGYQGAAAATVKIAFKLNNQIAVGETIAVVLPSWILTGTAAPTTTGCGTTSFTTAVAASTQADASITFTAATALLAASTACTIETATATAAPSATVAGVTTANLATYTISKNAVGAVPVASTPALTSPLGNTELRLVYPVIGVATAATFKFTTAAIIDAGAKIKLTLPYFTITAGALTGSTGCVLVTTNAVVANSAAIGASVEFEVGTAVIAASTACTITIPSTMLTQVATATQSLSIAQAQNWASRTADLTNIAATTSDPAAAAITISTPTVASAAFASNSALVVATTTGSTATSLALTFDSNIPLAIGDYVMLTLPDWGVSGTTAPTAVGCGTSTFTTLTGNSGTATAYAQFSVATAVLATATYEAHHYSMGHNCTLTWASGATTPPTAQAANLATRKLAAIIAAGADIANTTIATSTATTAAPTPTPTPTSGGNSTSTCTYSAASTCATRVTQSVVVSSLTAANYIGNLKKVYECGYAQVVRSDFCTTSSGVTTIKTGVQVTSTAAARRAATITFVMDVETGVMGTALLQTAIQDGVTATALVSKMTVIRTSTGWSAVTLPAVADLTVNTAAFTGAATSSAAVVIPSALMVLLGSFISLFWN